MTVRAGYEENGDDMTVYVSKPQHVEAVQWRGDNSNECWEFCKAKVRYALGSLELLAGVDGAQDWVPVPIGHWLVHPVGDTSDIWPVEEDYFAGKYDQATALYFDEATDA